MVKKLPILAILLIGSLVSFGQTTTQKIEEAKTSPATPANAAKADARVVDQKTTTASAPTATVATAKKKPGQFVHLIAKLDKTVPVEYDAVKNPNYLSFMAYDSLGSNMKVIYRKEKPANLEHSERLVLKGKMGDDHFECSEILMKCPSKYKDDMNQAKKSLQENAATTPAKNNTTQYQ